MKVYVKISSIVLVSLIAGCLFLSCNQGGSSDTTWLRGANFTPSTAINQLEFWQEETFDPETIDRELGWAEEIGFNCMRVYLHHLAWEVDKPGFKDRMGQYLAIADKHNIRTIFVFLTIAGTPPIVPANNPIQNPGSIIRDG